jgi:hypothetical protein
VWTTTSHRPVDVINQTAPRRRDDCCVVGNWNKSLSSSLANFRFIQMFPTMGVSQTENKRERAEGEEETERERDAFPDDISSALSLILSLF